MESKRPKIISRLIQYIKPHSLWMILAIALIVSLSILELINPYLVKIAIDDKINGFKHPYNIIEMDQAQRSKTIPYRDDLLLTQDPTAHGHSVFQIVFVQGNYFGFESQSPIEISEVSREGDSLIINGTPYPAEQLAKEQLSELRKYDRADMYTIGFWMLLVIVGIALFTYLQKLLLEYIGQNILYNLRKDIFKKITRLPMSYFDKTPVGQIVTLISNDTERLNDMYINFFINLISNIFYLVGIMGAMLLLDWRLALINFTLLPILFFLTVHFNKKSRDVYRRLREKISQLNVFLSENLGGIYVIKIFAREKRTYEEMKLINDEIRQADYNKGDLLRSFRPYIQFISNLSLTFILFFGGQMVFSRGIEFGLLFAFINYFNKFSTPLNVLAENMNMFQSSIVSAERIFDFLDLEEEEDTGRLSLSKENIRGEIEFKDVWFAYGEENWILKDVSFKVEAGQTIAIVGPTGAGKTSITNLINRFYDIQSGQILIDGVDIKTLDQGSLRKHIGMVLQDVFLFSGDVYSNITLGNKRIKREQVEEAVDFLNAKDFIEQLTDKYNHQVNEGGTTFSSGQRQLISFARALVYQPEILILDEATSNIDTETETLIQEAIKKLIKGRTTIAIAHRLSTIKNSDLILVVEDGRIIEKGNHQELLTKGEKYYQLYQLQYEQERTGGA